MNILALDPATKTGWALSQSGFISAGTWTLARPAEIASAGKSRMNRRLDPRIPTLWSKLTEIHLNTPLDWVVWEDVLFSSSTLQTMLWASFRTTFWIFSSLNRIQTECLPVATLKKFATGHGGATKEMMAMALVRSDPRFLLEKGLVKDSVSGISLTDDAVDAIHLLKWAIKTLKNA